MRFLLPVFLLLPFLARSAIVCDLVDDGQVVEIRCWEDGSPGIPSDSNLVMTVQACEEIKTKALTRLTETHSLVASLLQACRDAVTDLEGNLEADAWYVFSLVRDFPEQYTNQVYYTDLLDSASDLGQQISSTKENIQGLVSQLEASQPPIVQAISEIRAYQCADGACSGSGSDLGCPCAGEFASLLQVLTGMKNKIDETFTELVTVRVLQKSTNEAVTNINECVEAIRKRVESPDDRMFSELQNIYTRYFTNITKIASSALNLQEILYKFQQLIHGEDADSPTPLQLTTEGVIGLHQLAFDMANLSANQAQYSNLVTIVTAYTNDIQRYFHQWKNVSAFLFLTTPTPHQQAYIYDAMTNDSITAFSRAARLSNKTTGGVTNWFQRMEMYQQAQLGWFDNGLEFSPSENQAENTESSLEHQVMETTNNLGRVNTEATNLVLSVESYVMPVVQEFAGVEIVASLPTLVTLFPEISVPTFHTSFGPIVWDTTDSVEMLEFGRKVTGLVWKCAFWVMCVFLGVGISRVCMILVMYVIHIVKNL